MVLRVQSDDICLQPLLAPVPCRFAATVIESPTHQKGVHPLVPSFTELLLNDEADLDWLDAEGPQDPELAMLRVPEGSPGGASQGSAGGGRARRATRSRGPLADGDAAGGGSEEGGALCELLGAAVGAGRSQKRPRTDEELSACRRARDARYAKRCQRRKGMRTDALRRELAEGGAWGGSAGAHSATSVREPPLGTACGREGSTEGPGGEPSAVPCGGAAPAGAAAYCPHASTAQPCGLQPPVFSALQLRQLYVQVQMHAQLLLQTVALCSGECVAHALAVDVHKAWGWSNDALMQGGPSEARVRPALCHVL